MDCSKITKGLAAFNCGKPPIGGTNGRVILLNYADVDRQLSQVAENVITEIILKGNAHGYVYESKDNSTVGTTTLNKGTYFGNFQHDLALKLLSKSEESKAFFNSLNGARVIAIVENKNMGNDAGSTKYEVYGWDAGLELNAGTGTTEMADGVVYDLTLGSSDNSKEGSLPKSFFTTDLATTETALTSLLGVA